MNTSNNNLSFLDLVSLGSAGLGVYNTVLNQKQISNDELFEKIVEELKNEFRELLVDIKEIMEGEKLMYKKLLDKMKENPTKENFATISEVAEMSMYDLKEKNPKLYEHLEKLLYEAVNGKKLTKEKAENIAHNFKPYGMKWTYDQTSDVLNSLGYSIDPIEFFIVMNSAYNDYHDLFDEDAEKYAKYSKMFIDDKDAKNGKVYTYFTEIAE